MKRILAAILIFVLLLLCACGETNEDVESQEKDEYIELTMENYEYYLTIQEVLTDKTFLAGSTHYYYTATIYGAVNGLYKDCVIVFNGRILNLNAAGFAEFSYVDTKPKVTSVSGRIYIN